MLNAMQADSIIWPIDGTDQEWEQRFYKNGDCEFLPKSLAGKECRLQELFPADYLLDVKYHPESNCSCAKSNFPLEFRNCPECGTLLIQKELKDDDKDGNWLPPYGKGDGLKIVDNILNIGVDHIGERFELPPYNAFYAFCSIKLGCRRKVLLAIQKNNGALWIYHSQKKKWSQLKSCTGSSESLPSWSWSVASDERGTGLCIPADASPVWVQVDWIGADVSLVRSEGKSCGGAISLGNFVMVPVLHTDGSLSIATLKDGDSAWSEAHSLDVSTDGAELIGKIDGSRSVTGMPVRDSLRNVVYWPCRKGYIQASINDSYFPQWSFRPWETDEYPAKALIELGPPHTQGDVNSSLWQLCMDHDEAMHDDTVYKVFRLGGRLNGLEGTDWDIIEEGQILTTGKACFSTVYDFWKQRGEKDQRAVEQKELRIPLLESKKDGIVLHIKVTSWPNRDDRDTFTDFLLNKEASTYISFALGKSGTAPRLLAVKGIDGYDKKKVIDFFYKVSKIQDITAFIHDNALFIYLPEKKEAFCWRLAVEA